VLSPFLFWKPASHALRRIALRLIGALILVASLATGLTAIGRDFSAAYRSSPSVFAPEDRRQFQYVRERLPAGDPLLIFATKADRWHTCLWQRALYPRNPAIVRYRDKRASASLGDEVRRFRIRYAVAFGNPPPDPGFGRFEELGALPGTYGRVRFGPLGP
jgi:hypothetical protein